MKDVLLKIEESKNNGYFDMSFSGRISKAGTLAFVSAIYLVIQYFH